MHRQPEHVMTFLLSEMGTSGSLDGQQRLVVKGRFAPKNFEGILRRYVSEYSLLIFLLMFWVCGLLRSVMHSNVASRTSLCCFFIFTYKKNIYFLEFRTNNLS